MSNGGTIKTADSGGAPEMFGLDADTQRVYQTMRMRPDLGVADLAQYLAISELDVRGALDKLFGLALLRQSMDQPGQLRAVSPTLALQSVLHRQQAELARLKAEVAIGQATMTELIADRALSANGSQGTAERLDGMDAIHDRLEELTQSACREILSIMPGGAQATDALDAGRRNDRQLRANAVRIRVVMQDSVRNDRMTLAYAHWLTAAGGEVRTAPVLPPRMVIVDQETAIVPIDPDNTRSGAIQLSGHGVIAALAALFDTVWATAIPLGADKPPAHTDTPDGRLTVLEREVLGMLAQGLTDESVAKRLGISERTARRMVAALMERLNARSRFEAGLRAAQRGWL